MSLSEYWLDSCKSRENEPLLTAANGLVTVVYLILSITGPERVKIFEKFTPDQIRSLMVGKKM